MREFEGPPTKPRHPLKIAILDDYQNVALSIADWSAVAKKAEITVFNDHIDQTDALIERLLPFDVICVMRERTPLRRDVIERLPRLRFIASTGSRNISIDIAAANERGILVAHAGYRSTPTVELTWALILASVRHLVGENDSIRNGGWQTSIGHEHGRVLGVLELGNVGGEVGRIGRAFGMKIIAWSQNLTAKAAAAAGAELVTKGELFQRSDILTIHLILSKRSSKLCAQGRSRERQSTFLTRSPCRRTTHSDLSRTYWRRRISDLLPRISTVPSTATRRRRSEHG